jgi:hypothetical protein
MPPPARCSLRRRAAPGTLPAQTPQSADELQPECQSKKYAALTHRDDRHAQRDPEQDPGRAGHGQRRLRLHPERALAGKGACGGGRVALAEDAEYGGSGVEDDSEGLGGGADGYVDEIPGCML